MKPAIPSFAFVSQRRHLSRLPCGALRAAWTGSVAAAEEFPDTREWQAVNWQPSLSTGEWAAGRQGR